MAFITQKARTQHGPPAQSKEDAQALEALVSGVNAISQSTLLLKKKKEMHEVDDALDYVKEEYKRRIEACDQRQRKFEKRQSDMKEQVTKFEKFIQENDSKRQRADVKARGEHRVLDQKEQEQKRQAKELRALERERRRQIDHLEKLRAYKEYLERTVEAAEDETAEEVWDLLNRHTTLRNANVDLAEQVAGGDVETDDLRARLETLKLQAQSAALVQNSQIHAKQKSLEALRARTLAARVLRASNELPLDARRGSTKQADDRKLTSEERVKDVTRETAQIMLSVRNLYSRCLQTMHTRVAAVSFHDDEKRPEAERLHRLSLCLDLICERLNDLDDIKKEHDRGGPSGTR